MPLTDLRQYTPQQWSSLTIVPFANPPQRSSSGTPTNRAVVEPAGWLNNNTFAFKIRTTPNNSSGLSIDQGQPAEVNVNVIPSASPAGSETYWSVVTEQGNGKDDQWRMTYDMQQSSSSTGKWVFVKG